MQRQSLFTAPASPFDFAQDEAFHDHPQNKNPRAGRRGFGSSSKDRRRRLDEALALGALPSKFASAAHSFGLLARLLFRRLLEIGARFHFTEQAFALHLFLQGA